MAITNISVVSVPVTDQDRAKSFYTEKLGFSAEVDGSFGEGMRWVMLRPPGGGTAITLVTWFDTMPAGSLTGSVLACDDLEKTLANLAARGVSFHEDEVEEAPWGRWKTFDDPDGNGWVLQQDNPDFGGERHRARPCAPQWSRTPGARRRHAARPVDVALGTPEPAFCDIHEGVSPVRAAAAGGWRGW